MRRNYYNSNDEFDYYESNWDRTWWTDNQGRKVLKVRNVDTGATKLIVQKDPDSEGWDRKWEYRNGNRILVLRNRKTGYIQERYL